LTKVLMIFIDGFGLGARRDDNPYFFARTPFFDQLLGGHILYADSQVVQGDRAVMIPTDACLGVPGIPQSATGPYLL
jgi:2,3-bisphosphoglycerate-independent phosphoglycerate mutase